MSSLHLQEGCDVARMSQLTHNSSTRRLLDRGGRHAEPVRLGPISLSGAITAVWQPNAIVLTWLRHPECGANTAAGTWSVGRLVSLANVWGFVLFVLLSFLFNAKRRDYVLGHSECVRVPVVRRFDCFRCDDWIFIACPSGMGLMRSFSTWYAIALALSLLTRGVGVVNDRLLGALIPLALWR